MLTAAHCFPKNIAEKDVQIKLGVTDIKKGKWESIERVVPHKEFNRKTKEHDIALIKLAKAPPAKFEQVISTTGNVTLSARKLLEVTGWGITEKGDVSDRLCKTTVPYIDSDTCDKTKAYSVGIRSGMLCAGHKKGGKGSCGGDSGGPLVLRSTKPPTLVGIVSFGTKRCAEPKKPQVYTRVSAYQNWIIQNFKNYKD